MAIDALSELHDRAAQLEAAKDGIARRVLKLVDTLQSEELPLPERAQLQHLCRVAAASDSFEELRIFIQYQAARVWHRNRGIKVGEHLLTQLQQLHGASEAGADNDDPLLMEKVRVFLGYLARYATYKSKKGNASSGTGTAAQGGGSLPPNRSSRRGPQDGRPWQRSAGGRPGVQTTQPAHNPGRTQ